jgi:hypothetical protein
MIVHAAAIMQSTFVRKPPRKAAPFLRLSSFPLSFMVPRHFGSSLFSMVGLVHHHELMAHGLYGLMPFPNEIHRRPIGLND